MSTSSLHKKWDNHPWLKKFKFRAGDRNASVVCPHCGKDLRSVSFGIEACEYSLMLFIIEHLTVHLQRIREGHE